MDIRFQVLRPGAVLPRRAHVGDAGLDLAVCEPLELAPGSRGRFPTGLAVELPAGHVGLIVSRSGVALRHGLIVLNSPGVIDAGYRGEIQVLLANLGSSRVVLPASSRVAQLLVLNLAEAQPVLATDLSASERSSQGFGSSGS